MGDVQIVVHFAQRRDEQGDLLFHRFAAELHDVGDLGVALGRSLLLGVEGDDLRQIHGVGRAVDDVRAVFVKGSASLVRHGVDDAKERVGERHAGEALGVMHAVALCHIAIVGIDQIVLDHLDGVQRQRIGEIAVGGGNIRFNGVGHGVHTGVGNQLPGHGFSEIWIDDGHVGRDLKVGNRALDAFGIVRDDRESRHLGGRAGRGGNGAEARLLAQLRQTEYLAHIFKRRLRIFVLDPHGLGRVDGRAAAHGNDPIRLEADHGLRAAHDGLDRRIRLNAFKQLDFHSRFAQVVRSFIQKAKALHGAAADADHRALAFKRFERFKRTLSMIQISG